MQVVAEVARNDFHVTAWSGVGLVASRPEVAPAALPKARSPSLEPCAAGNRR
jgi:hypothetical protein